MTRTSTTSFVSDAVDAAANVGGKLLRTFTDAIGSFERDAKDLLESATGTISGKLGCSCARPHACWMPDELPAITSVVCGCGTAVVRVTVRNCGIAARNVFLAATGPDAGLVIGAPSTATIGALESAELVAELTLPKGTYTAHVILWVRGCHDTALPWTVTASARGGGSTHEVAIEDCPDTYHSWHDHFAQPRPCRHRRDD